MSGLAHSFAQGGQVFLLGRVFAAGLTQVIFPLGWPALVNGSAVITGVLVARNMLLVAATVLSCWRILSASFAGDDVPAQLAQQVH